MNKADEKIEKNELASLNFRRRLRAEFELRQSKNPRYSLRAFAFALETDASTLKKILDGKRPLGGLSIQKLGRKLGFSEDEIFKFVEAHRRRRELGIRIEDERHQMSYRVLTSEHAPLMETPTSYAVLELLKIEGFDLSVDSISTALGLSTPDAVDLLDRLQALKWVEKSENGEWRSTLGNTTVDPLDVDTKRARERLMESVLEKSLEAYRRTPRELRSHSANTFAIKRSLLPEAVAKIKALSRELEAMMSVQSDHPDEVYQLQIGFFPLTRLYQSDERAPKSEDLLPALTSS